jgi:hypothetical protein
MEPWFTVDSCVASARIVLDSLDYFGIAGVAIPVEVVAFNAAAVEVLRENADAGDPIGVLGEVVARWRPEDAGGPWSLGLGMGMSTGDAPNAGHVVVGVPGEGLLLDLSLAQASRPVKNMVLGPSVFDEVPDEFFAEPGAVVERFVAQGSGGPVALVYRHAPVALYRTSPNWVRETTRSGGRAVFRRVTGDVIRQVRHQTTNES